jgi:hypothetical protein
MLTLALGGIWLVGGGLLALVILTLWIVGLLDVSRRSDLDRRGRAAWILLIILFPIVGTVAYFAMRPTLPEERDKIVAAQTRPR